MAIKRRVLLSLLLISVSSLVMADSEGRGFTDIHGNAIHMTDYRGKWVVVNYWATWCPPCLEELPELTHFHDTHKDDLAVVLGVNMEDISRAELLAFVDDYMLSFPIIPMSEDMPSFGAIPGLPTTFLIDPDGQPVARQVGKVTAQMIEDFINGENQGAP